MVSESQGENRGVIAVVGSLNADLVIQLQDFPAEGETVLGDSVTHFPGGKGLNQAVAAHRAGAQVSLIGAIGPDSLGSTLKEVVAREGLEDHVAVLDGHSSGTAIIEVDPTGANRIVVVGGANSHLTPDMVEVALRETHEQHRIGVVLVQCEIPIESIARALDVGRSLGAVTILNPAPIREFTSEIFKHTDYLIPNEHEAHEISKVTAQPLKSMLDCVEAANSMLDLGVKNVIVTRGEKGAVWANANGSGQTGAFRIVPIDTVAAGDAFCAVFACAINEGKPFSEALRWASAAGALAATKSGAVASLPQRKEIEELLGITN